jgi:hypothetical protein
VTITETLGGASTTINVTVRADAAITGRVGSVNVTVPLLGSKKLAYRSSSPNPYLRWNSSNKQVAIVADYGEVYAYKAGTAIISATDKFGHVVKWRVTVPKVSASAVKVARIAAVTFNGRRQTPAPVVTYKGQRLKKGTDYTVRYLRNVNVGVATVAIQFKGSFTGKKNVRFKIVAPRVDRPTITYWYHGSYYSKIEWDTGSNAHGVQLSITGGGCAPYNKHISGYSGYGWCNKGYANARTVFRVRSYRRVGGKLFYSAWVTMVL